MTLYDLAAVFGTVVAAAIAFVAVVIGAAWLYVHQRVKMSE